MGFFCGSGATFQGPLRGVRWLSHLVTNSSQDAATPQLGDLDMQNTSARLSLPYIQPAQAQKHVTHNEALRRLDLLTQLTVEALDATDPPAETQNGQVWALGAAPTGAWAGQGQTLALWADEAWFFVPLQPGWQAVLRPEERIHIWDGSACQAAGGADLDQLDGLGVNTSFDTYNRFAVAAPASLLTHEGAGHQLKVNKNADTDTASLLFQTGWSGRAEMGTTGSDDFAIKVSADGSAWHTGLTFDANTGQATAPVGLSVDGTLSGSAVMQDALDAGAGRIMTQGAFGLGSTGDDLPILPSLSAMDTRTGFYQLSDSTINVSTRPTGSSSFGAIEIFYMGSGAPVQVFTDLADGKQYIRHAQTGSWQTWQSRWDGGNTTVDANGFLKAASPIVRLSDTGTSEPVLPVGAVWAKADTGHYTLSDVPPLARQGWQIEVPQDHNGNRLVFVDTHYDAENRRLHVSTKTVGWDSDQGRWIGVTPVDIPAGRWVDIRLDDLDILDQGLVSA